MGRVLLVYEVDFFRGMWYGGGMKKTVVDVTFRLIVFAEDTDVSVLEVVKDLDWDFRSQTDGASVEDAKVVAVDIDDEDF